MTNETTAEAVRALLFRKAEAVNERLLARLAQVTSHVGQQEHLAALGALEGVEADIVKLRSLLLLVRDCFTPAREPLPPAAKKGGDD